MVGLYAFTNILASSVIYSIYTHRSKINVILSCLVVKL